ncbi:MAG: 4-hydroxythreonine-4-phosphate dehydrogenase [Anaerolineae bacterium SM23_84]|nr:MAG: 4-hydroxythreonine-4-phosphate dehydrogenase [Anaerolineae bacterium SM23_84]
MASTRPAPTRPTIAVTIGDPAGIGPEVTVKALAEKELYLLCQPLVIGDAGVVRRAAEIAGVALVCRPVSGIASARFEHGTLDMLDLKNVQWGQLELKRASAAGGRASVEYVSMAVQLALSDEIDAIATGPINKQAIHLAGYEYIGHTELLADLTNARRCTTMLATRDLRVTHVTRHVPLRDVASHITKHRVLDTILVTAEGLRQLGLERPRLGVAALNPHGGDDGLLGQEEIEQIAPAVTAAREMGIDVRGPFPADSIFCRATAGEFDAVVAMYHDQGHIPIKVHDFERSYTVTLGLPIVRTSVDHGTAFDIAWQGTASPAGMTEAIKAAATLARRRHG